MMKLRVTAGSAEPVVQRWEQTHAEALVRGLGILEPARPAVLAVDGRSGAGKSTLATHLAAAIPGATVAATDDVAWWFSMFDWSAELIAHVIEPVRRGEAVAYRPPGWIVRERPGAVTVPANLSLLVIEGVGSSQAALIDAIDAAIWVQSDAVAAREHGLARDIASGDNGDAEETALFWDEWAAEEEPFLERDAPWTRADAIVAGVPLLRPPVLYRAGGAVPYAHVAGVP